jgi:hypothetical protein
VRSEDDATRTDDPLGLNDLQHRSKGGHPAGIVRAGCALRQRFCGRDDDVSGDVLGTAPVSKNANPGEAAGGGDYREARSGRSERLGWMSPQVAPSLGWISPQVAPVDVPPVGSDGCPLSHPPSCGLMVFRPDRGSHVKKTRSTRVPIPSTKNCLVSETEGGFLAIRPGIAVPRLARAATNRIVAGCAETARRPIPRAARNENRGRRTAALPPTIRGAPNCGPHT